MCDQQQLGGLLSHPLAAFSVSLLAILEAGERAATLLNLQTQEGQGSYILSLSVKKLKIPKVGELETNAAESAASVKYVQETRGRRN